jgi:16S rRNA processing protein RimM
MNDEKNMQKKLVCVAKISSAHGIKGAVKVKSFTEDPMSVADFTVLYNKDASEEYALEVQSCSQNMLLAYIDGVNDRNEAEALKNKELFIYRDELEDPEDEEFYYEDLVGLRVKLQNGKEYGQIYSIQNYGAGDILEVKLKSDNKKVLMPFTKEIFPNINIKSGSVVIIPPDTEDI